MKYKIITLLHIVFIFLWLSIAAKATNTAGKEGVRTVITGALLYADTENVSLIIWDNDNLVQISRTMLTHSTKGFFKFEFVLDHPRNISLVVGGARVSGDDSVGLTGEIIVVEPGDSLHITIPSANSRISKDVTFSGKGAEKQYILDEINSALKGLIKNWTDKPIWDQKTIASFNIVCRELYQTQLTKNKEAISTAAFNHLKATLMGILHYSSIEVLEIDNNPGSESRKFYTELYVKNFPISDLIVSEDRVVMGTVLEKRALLDHVVANTLPYEAKYHNDVPYMYEILCKRYDGSPIKSRVLAGYIISQAKYTGWNSDLENASIDYLSETGSDDQYRNQVLEVKNKMKSNLAINAQAFDFALLDTLENIVTLKQFEGKIVLLEFMVYGCEGCFNIAPVLHEIEQRFKDEDVAFISISVDDTSEHFKKGIGKFTSPTSIPLYTNGEGTNHEIVRHYGIIGYPTLILIDKEGKILASRVPDPRLKENKEKLIKLIETHL